MAPLAYCDMYRVTLMLGQITPFCRLLSRHFVYWVGHKTDLYDVV